LTGGVASPTPIPPGYGLLSPYRPTGGGLAGYTAALAAELRTGPPAGRVGVVRVVDWIERSARAEVVHHLLTSAPGGEAEAAAILNDFDVVIVHHDDGIYGGPDGDQLVSVLARLTAPVIVVLHTIPDDPTLHQRDVLEQVLAAADAIVTMSPSAQRRLLQDHFVDPARVAVIPHGAPLLWSDVAEQYRALAGALLDSAEVAVG
jgi:polysaccharide biosynthesis protein PslF